MYTCHPHLLMSGADCITTDVKTHLGKRPLVAGDDYSQLGGGGEETQQARER